MEGLSQFPGDGDPWDDSDWQSILYSAGAGKFLD